METALLTLRGVTKTYAGPRARRLLHDINLDLARGEYIAVTGESGAGKSTLLNLISGLDWPDAGHILFDGAELGALEDAARTRLRGARMGFVFQAFHLLPHLTVAQNIALPLVLNGVEAKTVEARVDELLQEVGIAGTGQAYPAELSGGEMQRVAIARALAHRPALVLADEPTGNLDPESATQVLHLLRDQIRHDHAAGILVTHSPVAAATADRVYVLSADGLTLKC